MSRAALVVMAAGLGSRFGDGIKQLEPVGPNGEIIMEYSIYDALKAGFDKVVFVIRRDLESSFRDAVGKRIEQITDVAYVYQEVEDIPDLYRERFAGRTKPWGTGQAILCCKDAVSCPFLVINADDYYGKEAFVKLHEYLVSHTGISDNKINICMAGFILKNTLSENGGVTRGVCEVDAGGNLLKVTETYEIQRKDGVLHARDEDGQIVPVEEDQYVSMNMWGLYPEIFDELEQGFREFLEEQKEGDLKKEYLLPKIIDQLLMNQKATVKALETTDKWFGVTYQEDRQSVTDAICNLTAQGIYKERLF